MAKRVFRYPITVCFGAAFLTISGRLLSAVHMMSPARGAEEYGWGVVLFGIGMMLGCSIAGAAIYWEWQRGSED
jgi:hypothetical protein